VTSLISQSCRLYSIPSYNILYIMSWTKERELELSFHNDSPKDSIFCHSITYFPYRKKYFSGPGVKETKNKYDIFQN